jgi:endoglucanase
MLRRLVPCLLGLCFLAGFAGCDSGGSSPPSPANAAPVAPRGCSVTTGSAPPVAPGGYYTNGTTVCTAGGVAHLFHGVDRPSMEWDPQGEANDAEGIPASDFQNMAGWHANVVRIALNQDFWLSGAALYAPAYSSNVDRAVHNAEAAGMDVILDLHWSDEGNPAVMTVGKTQDDPTNSNQQPMADMNSKEFWSEVAAKYQGDGHVLFELYNEPHAISWPQWLNGGSYAGYQVVGMQELYDTVRATGANNVVIAGGLDYAYDLSDIGQNPIQGYNIMYATHPYAPQDAMAGWQGSFGYLATTDTAPVIATEFGDGQTACTGDWDTQLIQFADARQISWTAWAWWKGDCSFPALISDWNDTPTGQGQVVKSALLGYPYTPSSGGAGGKDGTGGSAGKGGGSAISEGGTAGEAGASAEAGAPAEGGASGDTSGIAPL